MKGIRAVCCAALLAVMSLATPATAEPSIEDLSEYGDYEVDHQDWNGLSTLAALAEGAGLQVVQRQSIEWEELDSDDIVLLIYPTSFVDPANIVDFIRNGGRVLIADDFGSGRSVFGHLGGRQSEDVVSDDYHDDQIFAPIARPTRQHPLSQGVLELTTNHPTVLSNLDGMESVFAFGGGEAVVAAGTVGAGRYVALSDPSVLINRMLQFEGNLQFGINLLRYLGRPDESDRMVVLSRGVSFSGIPRNRYDDGTLRGSASVLAAQFDRWLDQLNRWLLTARSLKVITVLLAMGLGLLVFLVIPRKRRKPLDGAWTRSGPGRDEHGYESLVQGYESAGPRKSYLLPAAIERDNVNTALELALDTPDPLYALSEPNLLALTKHSHGSEAAQALQLLLPRVRNIPQRAQAAAHYQPRFLGRGEFEIIHKQAALFFEHLESAPNET